MGIWVSAALLPYLPYVAGSARHATSCPQTGQVDHDPHQGASRVSGCHTRATQRCRCRGRSSNARTGRALVPAHRQGRGTTTLTWGRGSPLLSMQGHKCLPIDRAGAPRTTHVEGAHHCYTAGSQVQATLPCTCGCQHWLIRSAILPVNADRLALCKVPAHRQGRGTTNHTCGRGSPLLHSRVTSAGNAALHLRMPTLAYPQCTYCNHSSKIVSSTQQLTHTRDKRN